MVSKYLVCPGCGATLPIKRSGRKRLGIPVKIICDKLQLYRDVDAAAKELGCSRAYIYKVLKERGTTPKDVMEGKRNKIGQ